MAARPIEPGRELVVARQLDASLKQKRRRFGLGVTISKGGKPGVGLQHSVDFHFFALSPFRSGDLAAADARLTVLGRADNSRGPGGPRGPPRILCRLTKTH
jgi:hypothetical protein